MTDIWDSTSLLVNLIKYLQYLILSWTKESFIHNGEKGLFYIGKRKLKFVLHFLPWTRDSKFSLHEIEQFKHKTLERNMKFST